MVSAPFARTLPTSQHTTSPHTLHPTFPNTPPSLSPRRISHPSTRRRHDNDTCLTSPAQHRPDLKTYGNIVQAGQVSKKKKKKEKKKKKKKKKNTAGHPSPKKRKGGMEDPGEPPVKKRKGDA
ncbi:hypothetical protein T440DRAFT_527987 [Plenodomus tracheiphilus IPT5]|uniref:Uncharacterized protein n=1 Tax=Plenodomus tracheiphilus IPT5 TaxID=1408161 RepID=A0A6A7BA70_9PLEO|nr:hypothetical protein T440DRAFT_527987 [Plenodomus tracheiphilus IPT5]